MSKNYDNWERLVSAVLRRERDRQIALSHSRDPSSVSSTTSVSDLSFQYDCCESLVDRSPRSQLLIDYSDWALDHCKWDTMLPPDDDLLFQISRSAAHRCFGYPPRTGKNCFLLGATRVVTLSDGWSWQYDEKSRFSKVAVLGRHGKLDIRCRINTRMLSPETCYVAYLLYSLAKKEYCVYAKSCFHEDSFKWTRGIINFHFGVDRYDGWMEIELGDFYVPQDYEGEVELSLLQTGGLRKTDLFVEGIEFRPQSNLVGAVLRRERLRQMTLSHLIHCHCICGKSGGLSFSSSSPFHDPMLACHCMEQCLHSPSQDFDAVDYGYGRTTLLPRDNRENPTITVPGRVFLLTAESRELKFSCGETSECRQFTACCDEATIGDVRWLDIRGKMKTRMLNRNIVYGAYLLFQCTVAFEATGLESAMAMIRFGVDGKMDGDDDEEERARIMYQQPVDTLRRGVEIAAEREDGWLEILIGTFCMDEGEVDEEVEARLVETTRRKAGLVVLGIEFRPLVHYSPISKSDVICKMKYRL